MTLIESANLRDRVSDIASLVTGQTESCECAFDRQSIAIKGVMEVIYIALVPTPREPDGRQLWPCSPIHRGRRRW